MPTDRTEAAAGGGRGPRLGEVIASYRRRRRQPQRNAPWSQEELAFASGTDQAHVSRIESNRQHPEYSTLARICDALDLSQIERAYVLALAGYQIAAPLPDERDVDAVVAKLGPVLEGYPYPASLMDEGERIWHQNRLAVRLFGPLFGASDLAGWAAVARGQRTVEAIFDPDRYAEALPRWRAVYEDLDYMLTRNVALFWRACHVRLNDQELNRTVARLMRNPDFRRRWERVESGESDLLFIDHALYGIRHPQFGCLRMNSWRTRTAIDERFIVTHFSPVDAATSHLLQRLAEACAERL
jgi:transcriptional regulator with XRE-family HTH domain